MTTKPYSKYQHVSDAARVAPTFPGSPPSTTRSEPDGPVSTLALAGKAMLLSAFGVFAGLALGVASMMLLGGSVWDNAKLGVGLGMLAAVVLPGLYFAWHLFLVPVSTRPPTDTDAPKVTQISYVKPEEQVRIIQYKSASRLVDGVDVRDLTWFIDGLPERGWSQRAWLGLTTPTGRLVDPMCWFELCKPLRSAGVIEAVSERRKGRLTLTDPEEIKAHLGLQPPPSDTREF